MEGFYWVPDREATRDDKLKNGFTDASQRGFYLTPFWRQFREYKLHIDPLCKICHDNGKLVEASIVDHIEPVPKNITFIEFVERTTIDKTQSLCKTCHPKKTAYDRHGKKMLTKKDIKENMSRYED